MPRSGSRRQTGSAMPDDAISVADLKKTFGMCRAVDGVSFSVRRGEVFGLVGPDGAGKTTTLRMLAGVLYPSAGSITVLGQNAVTDPESIKPLVGYMPQTFGLYGSLTVMENLNFYADLYGVPPGVRPERIHRLLSFSRLEPFTNRLAQNLSGGMKQKLALAATLISQPELILLDEPTTGVDPVSRRDFWAILYNLNVEGMTILVSTPYMDEADRCSRLGFMFNGKVIALDTPECIRGLMHGEILELVTPHERRARKLLVDMPGVINVGIFGDRVHVVVQNARAMTGPILERLAPEGVQIEQIRQIPPGLEDVFISLIR